MSIFCFSCRSTLIRIAFLSAFVSSRTVLWHNTCPRGDVEVVIFWCGVNAIIGYLIGKSKNEVGGAIVLSILLGPIWMAHRGSKPGTFAKVSILRGAGETGSDGLANIVEQIAADL